MSSCIFSSKCPDSDFLSTDVLCSITFAVLTSTDLYKDFMYNIWRFLFVAAVDLGLFSDNPVIHFLPFGELIVWLWSRVCFCINVWRANHIIPLQDLKIIVGKIYYYYLLFFNTKESNFSWSWLLAQQKNNKKKILHHDTYDGLGDCVF